MAAVVFLKNKFARKTYTHYKGVGENSGISHVQEEEEEEEEGKKKKRRNTGMKPI